MNKAITEFSKSTREKVVLSLSEFKGKTYLDVRLYLVGESGCSDIPTKKGICLGVNIYPQLKEALGRVEAALISRGLLDREDLEALG